MPLPYHTHTFTIPTATEAEVVAATRDDVVVTPAVLVAKAVPGGGTTGQVLGKTSDTDNAVQWQNGGAGDVLKANNLSDLDDAVTANTNIGAPGVDVRRFGMGPSRTAAQNVTAFNLALSYVTELWVPPIDSGDYFDVDDEFIIPDNVKIRGTGWHSKFRQLSRERNIFVSGHNSSFEGLHLIGDNLLTGVDFAKNNGIYASGKKGVRVQNCFGEQFESCGVHLRACDDYKIENNTLFAQPWGAIASSADIICYSGSAGGRGLIAGNSCLSNNSQGIFVDALGFDSDVIIANNHCVTLDASTCIEGGTWSEVTGVYDGLNDPVTNTRRRHGIAVGYTSSSVGGTRAIVANNICRNTNWTGIYKQSYAPEGGGTLIIGNRCSKNGKDLTAGGTGLKAGIYANSTGEDLIIGNVVTDFQNDDSGNGAILVSNGSLADAARRPTKVHGNLIVNSAGVGIALTTHAAQMDIRDNQIMGSVGTDIYAVGSSGALNGGHTIKGNRIKRTSGNDVPSIVVNTPGTTEITTIEDNYIEGFDKTNVVPTNAGIRTTQPLLTRVRRNRIRNFHVAYSSVAYFTTSTRHFDVTLEGNIIDNCTAGFGVSATDTTAVVPIVNNQFIGVTTKIGNNGNFTASGQKAGYICRKDNDRLVVLELSASPTIGTWAAGDRCEFPAPAAGGATGSLCAVAGNPGTWETISRAEAAIAAAVGVTVQGYDATTLKAAAIGVTVQAYDPQLSSLIRVNSKSAAYTLVLGDGGYVIFHPAADTTARIWTIPANASVAFPVGTVVGFDNQFNAGAITIAITSDTLELVGSGATGSRTLATGGYAVARKMTSTLWRISGGAELT